MRVALVAVLRWLVLAAWLASALSQLHAGWREWRLAPATPHPEMPRDQQGRMRAVLEACAGRVGPRDLLAVSGGDDAVDVFLRYRLAYVLYPAHVVEGGDTSERIQEALRRPGAFSRRYALVLDQPHLDVPGATAVQLTPGDRLYEAPRP